MYVVSHWCLQLPSQTPLKSDSENLFVSRSKNSENRVIFGVNKKEEPAVFNQKHNQKPVVGPIKLCKWIHSSRYNSGQLQPYLLASDSEDRFPHC